MSLTPAASYRRCLPHIQSHRPTFVTFVTHHRRKLPSTARDIIFKHCMRFHTQSVWMHALVVMPDHVHAVFSLFPQVTLPWVMHRMKGGSAYLVNKAHGWRGQLWQQESYDIVLRSRGRVEDVTRYIVANPVKAGLETPYPWLWDIRAVAGAT